MTPLIFLMACSTVAEIVPIGSTPIVRVQLSSTEAMQTLRPLTCVHWTLAATVTEQVGSVGLGIVCVDIVQDSANPELFDLRPGFVVPTAMQVFQSPAGISNPAGDIPGSGFGGTQVGTSGSRDIVQIGGAQNITGVAGNTVGLNTEVVEGIGNSTGGQVIVSGSWRLPSSSGVYLFRCTNIIAAVLKNVATPPARSELKIPIISASSDIQFDVADIGSCVCDVNRDGMVDDSDFGAFVLAYDALVVPPAEPACDFNDDYTVDDLDFSLFVIAYDNLLCP